MNEDFLNPYGAAYQNGSFKSPTNRIPSASEYFQKSKGFDHNGAGYNNKSTVGSTGVYTDNTTASSSNPASYQMSDRDFAAQQTQNSFSNNIDMASLGLSAVTDGLNAWNAYGQLSLKKDEFEFNKDMQTKQFTMAKDAYDRNIKRSQGISNAYSGFNSKNKPKQV